jgi:hypothetical protein
MNSPSHPRFLQIFFACGKTILRLQHLLPAPGAQTSNKRKSMLAYFMASPGIQSTSPSSQHSSTAAQQPAVPAAGARARVGARSRSQL